MNNHSKVAAPTDNCSASVVTAAMAWRVKYRKIDSKGKAVRIHLPISSLGVHPRNRGGPYPAGVRCKSLCLETIDTGFNLEEVNHAVVAVEEVPPEHIRSRGEDWVSASTYNIKASRQDELLCTCFSEPYNTVHHTLLAHNHIMLVIRAFLTKAQWNIQPILAKGLHFCDDEGKLSVAAVAAHENGKQIAQVLQEGIFSEILSWRMDVEEPTAASVISQALNKAHALALVTTELTAISVLKGEIMVQRQNNLGQGVAFQTVRDRVRAQLDTVVDDPDLQEVFDYLIHAGVGTNSYADDLLAFATIFVDSKKRRLRLCAFGAINKMSVQHQWVRVAVLKRAYRKKPSNGFCPNPESHWGEYDDGAMNKLEELLRFFHVACKPFFEKLQPQSRAKVMADIDIAATDTFFFYEKPRVKPNMKKLQERLLEACEKHLEHLGISPDDAFFTEQSWIKFHDANATAATAAAKAAPVAPVVICFDEETGKQRNQQVDFGTTPTTTAVPLIVKLPWREWHRDNKSMGAMQSDKSAAVAVLQGLHESFDADSQPIEILQTAAGMHYVSATKKVPAGQLMLPPCIPRSGRIVSQTDHPHAVPMQVCLKAPAADAIQPHAVRASREQTLYLLPEFTAPKQVKSHGSNESNTAVADPTAVADTAAVASVWEWSVDQKESLHPFWAVRRLTKAQLNHEIVSKKESGKRPPRFNCDFVIQRMSNVTVSAIRDHVHNFARMYNVPFLTNNVELKCDEELIVQVHPKPIKQDDRKRSWRDAVADQAKAKVAAHKKTALGK